MGKKPSKRFVILLSVLCAVLVVTAGVVFGVLHYVGNWSEGSLSGTTTPSLQEYDLILPGVSICGIDVSGLNREDAALRVSAVLQSQADAETFTVTFPDRELSIKKFRSKTIPTMDAVISEAWQHGRGIVSRLDEALRWAGDHPLALDPVCRESIDEDVIRSAVETFSESLEDRATNCIIRQSEDEITIIKGRDGKSIDPNSLTADILSACKAGKDSLTAEYDLTLSGQRQVEALHERFSIEPADARWDPETASILPEVVGRTFDLEAALEALNAPDGTEIRILVQHQEPAITAAVLEEKLFIDEMGSYSSPHTPIAPRTNNLVLACQAINGTVLNPGDVFSFNDTVGERTYERGYQNAAIYLNGETTDSVGGGICQVASTIYVCALRADLEIVQRTEHMYFVDYVPEGQDATIYWDGNLDFQFRNSTDYPMRIDASVSGGYVHIALWGTNEDGHYAVVTSETLSTTPWQVVINEDQTLPPDYQQVSITPYTGRVVRTYRNVYDRDGNLLSTAFEAESTYHKRDQVITVGKQPEEPVSPPEESVPDDIFPPDPEAPAPDEIFDPEQPSLPGDLPSEDASPGEEPPTEGAPESPEIFEFPEALVPPVEEPDKEGALPFPWFDTEDPTP